MAGKESVFISYRRSETKHEARQLQQALAVHLGTESVFWDERIEAGQHFPDELNEALHRARAVLVVVGPQWLQTLNTRAAQPAVLDWVRHEVSTSLQRHQAGPLPLLIPVLLPGARLPASNGWPPELAGNLAALSPWQADKRSFSGPAVDVHDLHWRIQLEAQVYPDVGVLQAQALRDLGAEVKRLLTAPDSRQIALAWKTPPFTPDIDDDIPAAISRFAAAIDDAKPWWVGLVRKRKAETAFTCLRVLTALYRMTVNLSLAQQWRHGQTAHAVPAISAGMAINVAAAAQGIAAWLEKDMVKHPAFANTVFADTTVNGIGSDQVGKIHKEVWAASRATNALGGFPGSGTQPLAGDNLAQLKSSVREAHNRSRPVIGVSKVDAKAPVDAVWRQVFDDLGMVHVAYAEHAANPLRFDEKHVHDALRSCMVSIKSLTA